MGRKIPMWQAVLVMLFLVAVLMYCLGVLGKATGIDALKCSYGEAHIPLIISAVLAGIVAVANGYKWKYLERGILSSINRSMQAILILLIVGILIGTWIASGVIPAMIYYGLTVLKPSIFLLASCILCCIAALATGSSWTTAGTIGIALIGIGQGLGISQAMTAGAIVSGAYFGDKMSPLSDTTNLAPAIAGASLFAHIRHMVYTVAPSILIAMVLYGVLGLNITSRDALDAVPAIQNGLKASFSINPALLIPPVMVIVVVALKLPAIPSLLGGIIIAMILGSIFQGVGIADWPGLMHHGYVFEVNDAFNSTSDRLFAAHPEIGKTYGVSTLADLEQADFANVAKDFGLDLTTQTQYNLLQLLSRGGMGSMLWTVNLILCALCFGGIMDASGMLGTVADGLLKIVHGTGSLVVITVFSCIFVNFVAADQYLSIILPGRMYREAFEDRRLKGKNLSRCLEDSGTITSSLIPWNTCGVTMQTFLGVKTWGGSGGGYGRWALFNLINPLVSILYGFTGITMEKMSDKEYSEILAEREKEKAEALKALEA